MLRLRVKEVAKEKQMSMSKLSRASDVSYKTVKRIYDNPTNPIGTDTLEKLAKALGVPVVSLLEEVPSDAAKNE